LRCHPDELKRRLSVKEYSDSKIKENVQAEILGDSIHHFIEKQMKKPLIEIDTTHISIENVAELIINVIKGQFDFSRFKPGKIDWLEELNNKNKLKQFFDL
jgi:adenylate kinase